MRSNALLVAAADLSEAIYRREENSRIDTLGNWQSPPDLFSFSGIQTETGEQHSYDSRTGVYNTTINFSILSDQLSTARLAVGQVDGKKTLSLTFLGTDGLQPDGDVNQVAELIAQASNWDRYYAAMWPIIEEALQIADQSDIEAFLVTGHSLGGILASHFAIDPRTWNLESKTSIVTFGSPGVISPPSGANSPHSVTNFVHTEDRIATDLADITAFSRLGLDVEIESDFVETQSTSESLKVPHDMRGYRDTLNSFVVNKDISTIFSNFVQFGFGDNFSGPASRNDLL